LFIGEFVESPGFWFSIWAAFPAFGFVFGYAIWKSYTGRVGDYHLEEDTEGVYNELKDLSAPPTQSKYFLADRSSTNAMYFNLVNK
jgi:hypothetical protein